MTHNLPIEPLQRLERHQGTLVNHLLKQAEYKQALLQVVEALRLSLVKEQETATSDRQILAAAANLAFLRRLTNLPDDVGKELEKLRSGEKSWLVERR